LNFVRVRWVRIWAVGGGWGRGRCERPELFTRLRITRHGLNARFKSQKLEDNTKIVGISSAEIYERPFCAPLKGDA